MAFSAFIENWTFPGYLLAALALIVPEYVKCALAQLSGHAFTPVPFSFGWVSYAFESFALSLGCNNMFMPKPDYSSILINGSSGHDRKVHSWIVSRLLRDFDFWKPDAVETRQRQMWADATNKDSASEQRHDKEAPSQVGLCISVFNAPSKLRAGVPVIDWVYCSGILVVVIQLGISAIPWVNNEESTTLKITAIGILLAFLTGALTRWSTEKRGCLRSKKTVVLTRGNGAQHAIVIIGEEGSLDLEILANLCPKMSHWACTVLFFVLWIEYLLGLLAFKGDPSFLIMIGGIGTIYNILVAGIPRKPEALGLPLEFKECIAHPEAMEALRLLEEEYPGVGKSTVKALFRRINYKVLEEQWKTRTAESKAKSSAAEE